MNKETGYSLGQIAYDVCHHAIDLKENQIQALLEIGFPFDEEAWELGDLAKAVLITSQEKVNEQDDWGLVRAN